MSDNESGQGLPSIPGLAVQQSLPVKIGAASGYQINPRLLEILVCPVTKGTLHYDAQRQELVSKAARLAYPIRDGIPIMLVEEARPLTE